jgi:hypothetical protein
MSQFLVQLIRKSYRHHRNGGAGRSALTKYIVAHDWVGSMQQLRFGTSCVCSCSLPDNASGSVGGRAIAEAIAANEDCALTQLEGVELVEYHGVLGMPSECDCRDNESILDSLRKKRLAERVKSARGGTR